MCFEGMTQIKEIFQMEKSSTHTFKNPHFANSEDQAWREPRA